MNRHPAIALARREFRLLRASRGTLGLLLLQAFLLYTVHTSIVTLEQSPAVLDTLEGRTTLVVLQSAFALSLFAGGIVAGYRSVVSERSTGSLLLTSSQPLRRWEILLGKILGRTTVVLLPTTVLALAYLVFGVWTFGGVSMVQAGVMMLVTAGYATVCVSIGVGISALHDNPTVVTLSAFAFLLMELLWKQLSRYIYTAATGQAVNWYDVTASGPLFLLERLLPVELYTVLTNYVLGLPNSSSYGHFSVLETLSSPDSATFTTTIVVGRAFESATAPLYLSGWFSAILLTAWPSLVVTLGALRLSRGDL